MPTCSHCKKELPRKSFSNSQLKKPSEERRCQECVQDSGVGADVEIPPDVGVRVPGGALLLRGENVYIGGRTQHLGSAALPPGKAYSYSRDYHPQFTKRQSDSVGAMKHAFDAAEIEKSPLDEAALEIETQTRAPTSTSSTQKQINESVLMATQRWYISALPMEIIRQCIDVALLYRDIMRNFDETLLAKNPLPNSKVVFPRILSAATEQNRPDIIALLNVFLGAPDCTNVWVFSEPDKEICCAWHGMDQDNSKLSGMSKEEILAYIHGPNNMLELQACYWCERSYLSGRKLSLCTKCRKFTYCCRECQLYDWKSFHKAECPDEDRVGFSRLEYLNKHGEKRFVFPSIIAPEDSNSIWRGDMLQLYLVKAMPDGRLGNKTKGFPRGFKVEPREYLAEHR